MGRSRGRLSFVGALIAASTLAVGGNWSIRRRIEAVWNANRDREQREDRDRHESRDPGNQSRAEGSAEANRDREERENRDRRESLDPGRQSCGDGSAQANLAPRPAAGAECPRLERQSRPARGAAMWAEAGPHRVLGHRARPSS